MITWHKNKDKGEKKHNERGEVKKKGNDRELSGGGGKTTEEIG